MPDNFADCDYFALFGIPQSATVDAEKLREQYQKLQAAAHPDRHAAAPEAQKRAAVQMSARINDAYQTLKNPLSRAAYLLSLRGADAFAEDNTAMPPEFLMRQIEWRETLETADAETRAGLLQTIAAERDAAQKDAAAALATNDVPAAVDAVRKWKYLEKMLSENAA